MVVQVIGREAEVVRVCQILARRRKNNPILLGEPGTGKTAVAEGLALLIASGGTLHGAPLPSVLQVRLTNVLPLPVLVLALSFLVALPRLATLG